MCFLPCRHWLGSSVLRHRTVAEAVQGTPGHPDRRLGGTGASPGQEAASGWHSPPVTPALRDPDTVVSSASPRGTLLFPSPLTSPLSCALLSDLPLGGGGRVALMDADKQAGQVPVFRLCAPEKVSRRGSGWRSSRGPTGPSWQGRNVSLAVRKKDLQPRAKVSVTS